MENYQGRCVVCFANQGSKWAVFCATTGRGRNSAYDTIGRIEGEEKPFDLTEEIAAVKEFSATKFSHLYNRDWSANQAMLEEEHAYASRHHL
ncbi:MAG TPA: hypothetical protein VFN35_27270 [Ktedonobacteraceae bacterium]|nr:hypothetical protein [Ktedonobacteraceae bacterium]